MNRPTENEKPRENEAVFLLARNHHPKRRQHDVDLLTVLIDAVKTTMRDRVASRDMIAVVRKFLARREPRSLADDLISFDDELAAVGMSHHPFASEKRDRPIGAVFNRDEVNECMWLILGQRRAAVVISELVESGDKPRDFI